MRDASGQLQAARALLAATLAVLGPARALADAQPQVSVEDGNVVVVSGDAKKALTRSTRDSEAVVSPDGQWVFYTRSASPVTGKPEDDAGDCASLSAPDEMRRVRVDGTGDELLLRGRAGGEPSQALCSFQSKQFTSDGNTVLFLSPAWTTSHALGSFDLKTRTARHIMPANDYAVLNWCTSKELHDALIVQQHRYLQFGGSYDWYWLYDPGGKKEIGPVGDFADIAAVKSDLDASGQCGS
jgi:hypothetical protein